MPEIGLFGSEGGAPTHGVPTLSVGKPSRLAPGASGAQRGKAGRLTYSRQAVPACSGVSTLKM